MYCHQCGKEVSADHDFCDKCGAMQVKSDTAQTELTSKKPSKKKLEGFSGWLALLGLGVFVAPIITVFSFFVDYEETGFNIFSVITLGLIALFVWLNYLMYKRKKSFKKWFIITTIINVCYAGLIALLASAANDPSISKEFALTEEETTEIYTQFGRAVFYAVVWGLYVWKSERVKNTFVNN